MTAIRNALRAGACGVTTAAVTGAATTWLTAQLGGQVFDHYFGSAAKFGVGVGLVAGAAVTIAFFQFQGRGEGSFLRA